MSELVITEAAEVTPTWLGRVLRESGALRAGEVSLMWLSSWWMSTQL